MQDAVQTVAPAFDDLPREQLAAIESLTKTIGREIFANLEQTQPLVWERRWWDDRLRRDANAYDRSVRGLMALLPALAIGITTSGSASSAIGVLLGLGLISAAVILAVTWELDPRLALPRSQQSADNLPRPLWGRGAACERR